MKKITLILFYVLLAEISCLHAQNYFPFPTGNATWQVTRCFYFFPPGWYDDIQISTSGEDTIINNKTYTKLFLVNHHAPGSDFDTIYPKVFIGGMRELNKKIYLVSDYLCLDTIERALYDFNPSNVGDTIYSQVASPGLLTFVPHIIYSIDSVLVGAAYHRRLHLADTSFVYFENWIDGAGSEAGLIYASHYMITDNSYDLICFSENGVNEYLNVNPGFGFCQAPLPPIVCDSLATGITGPDDFGTLLYPNPAANSVEVELKHPEKVTGYEVTDISGRMILTKMLNKNFREISFSIDVSELPEGIYFLRIFTADKRNYSFKLVKSL